jgi:DNA-binding MarR family transcriptional regulator
MKVERENEFRWLTTEEQRTWRAFHLASGRLQQAIDRDLQRHSKMPHAYYMILAMLSEAPQHGMRMTELADALMISMSRLSHATDRLQELGWVRRDADPSDRRVSVACLTDDGIGALSEAAPGHVTTVVENVFSRLTEEQVRQLHEISLAMLGALAPEADLETPLGPDNNSQGSTLR